MAKFGEGRTIIPHKLEMSDRPSSPTNDQLQRIASCNELGDTLDNPEFYREFLAAECIWLRKQNEHLKKISIDGWKIQRLATKQIRERLEAAKAFIDYVREDFTNDNEPIKEQDLLTAFDETWKIKPENRQ